MCGVLSSGMLLKVGEEECSGVRECPLAKGDLEDSKQSKAGFSRAGCCMRVKSEDCLRYQDTANNELRS